MWRLLWRNTALTLKEKHVSSVTPSYAFTINHPFKDCIWKIMLVSVQSQLDKIHSTSPVHCTVSHIQYCICYTSCLSVKTLILHTRQTWDLTRSLGDMPLHACRKFVEHNFSNSNLAESSVFLPQGNLKQRISFSNLQTESCFIVFI